MVASTQVYLHAHIALQSIKETAAVIIIPVWRRKRVRSAPRHQQTDRQPAVSIHNIDSLPPPPPPSSTSIPSRTTADAVPGAMMMIWDFACSSEQSCYNARGDGLLAVEQWADSRCGAAKMADSEGFGVLRMRESWGKKYKISRRLTFSVTAETFSTS